MTFPAPIGLALFTAGGIAQPTSHHVQLVSERYTTLLQLYAQLENYLGMCGVAPDPARLKPRRVTLARLKEAAQHAVDVLPVFHPV